MAGSLSARNIYVLMLALASFTIGVFVSEFQDSTNTRSIEQTILEFPTGSDNSESPEVDVSRKLTLAELLSEPNVFEMFRIAHNSIDAMSAEEVQALALEAASSGRGQAADYIVATCLRKLTQLSPPQTIAFIQSNSETLDQMFLSMAINNWLIQDPDSALKYVLEMEDTNLQQQLVYQLIDEPLLLKSRYRQDIDDLLGDQAQKVRFSKRFNSLSARQAFSEALALPSDKERRSFSRRAIDRWAKDDAVEAFKRVEEMPDSELKTEMISTIFQRYAKSDLSGAIAFVESMPLDNERLITQRISAIATEDPSRAMPLAEDFLQTTKDDAAIISVLSIWSNRNPDDVIRYIDNSHPSVRLKYFQRIYRSITYSHPEKALDLLVSRFDDYPLQAGAGIRTAVGTKNVEYAEILLQQTTNDSARFSLISAIASHKVRNDTRQALTWLQAYQHEPYYERIVGSLSNIVRDPSSAATLLTTVPDDIAETYAGGVASRWFRTDSQKALEWVDELPAGDKKSGAAYGLIQTIASENPDLAERYLPHITTPFKREEASEMIAISMLQKNRASADAIIQRLEITGSTAEKVREIAKQIDIVRP